MVKYADKIMLHLHTYRGHEDDHTVPFGLTQAGISEIVDTDIPYISRLLSDLVEDGLIYSEKKQVVGHDRKRNVYFLTEKGKRRARDLFEGYMEEEVELKTEDGKKRMKIKDISDHVNCRNEVLYALDNMNSEGVIDLVDGRDKRVDVFVDREKELERLEAKLETSGEDTSILSIEGNAGIGKTRLLMEFKKKAVDKGYEFITGRAYYEDSRPYLPVMDALREYEERHDIDDGFQIEPGKPTHDEGTAKNKREATFHDILDRVRSLSSHKPLIVFLDDIHWADRTTLNLLYFMADKLEGPRPQVLMIIAYRPEELTENEALRDVLRRLSREKKIDEIRLEPLKWSDTRDILKGTLGKKTLPEGFTKLVHDITEGNPLFIGECCKQMIEEDTIDLDTNRFPLSREEVNIPGIIKDVIRRRIDKLDRDTQRILKISSVMGERIDFSILYHILDKDRLELLDHVDVLVQRGLWMDTPDRRDFSFSHNLIQSVVYDALSPNLKRELHLAIADKIVDTDREGRRTCSRVARHYEKGGDLERAYIWFKKAGETAEKFFAYEDAAEMYEDALSLSARLDIDNLEVSNLLERLSWISTLMGDIDRSLDYQREAIDHLDEAADKQRMFRKIAHNYLLKGNLERVLDTLDEGLYLDEERVDRSKRTEYQRERCRLLEKKGSTLIEMGRLQEARETFERRKRIAERLDDTLELAKTYHHQGRVRWLSNELNRSLENFQKAIEYWKKEDEDEGLLRSYIQLARVKRLDGDIGACLDYIDRAIALAEDNDDREELAIFYNYLSDALIAVGRLEEALASSKKALEISREIEERSLVSLSASSLALIDLHTGDLNGAMDFVKRSLDLAEDIGMKSQEVQCHSLIAQIEIDRGELKKAEDHAGKALELALKTGSRSDEAMARITSGMVQIERERWDRALEELGRAEDLCDEVIGVFPFPGLSRIHYEYGRLWLKKGDERRAKDELDRALSLFEDRGMLLWAKKTEKLLSSI